MRIVFGIRSFIILLVATVFAISMLPTVDSYAASNNSKKTTTSATKKQASTKKSSSSKKQASRSSSKKKASSAALKPSESKFAALVVDAETGKVLYQKNAGNIRYPASLTKMMTLYLTFEALKKGKLSMDTQMSVSSKAASQPQTNISLDPGDKLPVRNAIESLVVRSANDASVVLAEAIGGTEWNFALMMTQKARQLGMKNTVFRNPNGLPDNKQYTTAYDMARLGIALRRDFPEYYHFFKLKSFTYAGITYPGHNRVLQKLDGADGIKTGYINASGFNLVTSVKRNGYTLVGVIMGGPSAASRDSMMVSMLNQKFAELGSKKSVVAGQGTSQKKTGNEAEVVAKTLPEPATIAEEAEPQPVVQGGNY